MLVFGGHGGVCMSDFWQLSAGFTWSLMQQGTDSGPPPRSHHAAAFDDITESLLLGLASGSDRGPWGVEEEV